MNKSNWLQVATTTTNESIRDEQVKLFRMIHPLSPEDLVRGQFRALSSTSGNEPCKKRDATGVGGGVGSNHPEFRHPPPTSLDCAQCHQAPPSHYMMHFKMVSMTTAGVGKAEVNQCFLCHQTTSWNDIKGVGFYKHH